MRFLAALSLFLLAAPSPEIRYFHFERPIAMPTQTGGQACVVVYPAIFPHASAQLADLRVYQNASEAQNSTETPYVLRSDVPLVSTNEDVALLNLGKSGNQTVFDAAMPSGSFSDIELAITGHDFLAMVTVAGSQTQTATNRTRLGSFTIFDLTRQKLGRSTILHLPESDFRYLHFQVAGIAPENVAGLSVTRMPASKPKFVNVAETAASTVKDRNSILEFTVPAHTPVDRLVFVPGQSPPNFSRDVEISISLVTRPPANDSGEPPQTVTAAGNILRVHSMEDGHRIDEEHLTVNAPQVDFAGPARWTVTIENHDDAPIQMKSVRLEMLERNLCFDAAAGSAYTLYYGDPALAAPQYDYASLFVLAQNPIAATLGAESANPADQPRPDERPFTEKHPALLWIALVMVIALLGFVALRSFKAAPENPS